VVETVLGDERAPNTLSRFHSVCGLLKWRQFEPEVILLAVGWYLRFSLSYRDVEELLGERGLHADHVTV
jgi:transposase-like protein